VCEKKRRRKLVAECMRLSWVVVGMLSVVGLFFRLWEKQAATSDQS
jgi:hypothetical protein